MCDIDEVDTPGRNTDTSVDGEEVDDGPPLPPRTPAPQVLREPESECHTIINHQRTKNHDPRLSYPGGED